MAVRYAFWRMAEIMLSKNIKKSYVITYIVVISMLFLYKHEKEIYIQIIKVYFCLLALKNELFQVKLDSIA